MQTSFPGMWVSRPGLGLETDQDHFCEVLVLVSVLVSEGGLEGVIHHPEKNSVSRFCVS